MAHPLTIQQKIDIGRVSMYLSLVDVARNKFLEATPFFDEKLPKLIALETDCVAWQYELNPTDPTLEAAANYLYALCGRYALKAQASLNPGGIIVIPSDGSGSTITIEGQIVEYVIGDSSMANPASSAASTPIGGATTVTLDYAVFPNSETIFYQGIPVALYPSNDFNYRAFYNANSTTYIFDGQYFTGLEDGYALKFDFLKITSRSSGGSGGGGGTTTGLQYTSINVSATGNTLNVPQLGTFVYAVQGSNIWINGQVTQSGTTLDFTSVGGVTIGQQILIIYTS